MLPVKLKKTDSIGLSLSWIKFKKALLINDSPALHRLSLPLLDCDLYQEADPNKLPKDNFMPIDTFIKQFTYHMPDSKLWSVVKTKKKRLRVENAIDFHPRNVKHQKSKSLMIYEVWYTTWEPDELQKGHEGQAHAFEFVKINGEFKFYGITSIP